MLGNLKWFFIVCYLKFVYFYWLLPSLNYKLIIVNCIFYIDTGVETPPPLTSSATFLASVSSNSPSLSGYINTPTPTVPQGTLNPINKM